MAQDHKRGLFASIFSSKKKTEEELQAEEEIRRKIEQRIREVLVINETPQADLPSLPEPVFTRKPVAEESVARESRVNSVLALGAGWHSSIEPVSALER